MVEVIKTLSKVHGHKVSLDAAGQSQNAILIFGKFKDAIQQHTEDKVIEIFMK